jgi:hypothetical protein
MRITIPKEPSFNVPKGTFRAILDDVRNLTNSGKVRLIFRIIEENGIDTGYVVGNNYDPSLRKGSSLRLAIETIRGKDFSEDELTMPFDLDVLRGFEVFVKVEHARNAGFEQPFVYLAELYHIPDGARVNRRATNELQTQNRYVQR